MRLRYELLLQFVLPLALPQSLWLWKRLRLRSRCPKLCSSKLCRSGSFLLGSGSHVCGCGPHVRRGPELRLQQQLQQLQ